MKNRQRKPASIRAGLLILAVLAAALIFDWSRDPDTMLSKGALVLWVIGPAMIGGAAASPLAVRASSLLRARAIVACSVLAFALAAAAIAILVLDLSWNRGLSSQSRPVGPRRSRVSDAGAIVGIQVVTGSIIGGLFAAYIERKYARRHREPGQASAGDQSKR